MNLEEEIVIFQFGQGLYSVGDLMDQFRKLDKAEKKKRIMDLTPLVEESEYIDSDIDQPMADNSFNSTDIPFVILYSYRSKKGLRVRLGENELEKSFTLLLSIFKTAYQRKFDQEKGNSTKWWLWDLSNDETVQGIVTRHQALIEQVYTTPGFRSEFVSLAKLWHHQTSSILETTEQETTAERQTKFDFLTYDEMVDVSIKGFNDKNGHSIALLRNSLDKALAKTYGLASRQSHRLIWDVVERHLQETYNRGLWD